MTASPDDINYVRLLIGDNYDDGIRLLSDDEINSVIGREPTLKRAAASLLEIIATSDALTSKKITTQDLAVDGPALAAAMFKQAANLRAQSDDDAIGDDGIALEDYREPWWFLRGPEMTEPEIGLSVSNDDIPPLGPII